MKKLVLLLALLLFGTGGVYFVHTYTGATVRNPVYLSISENAMVSLVPVEELLAIIPGERKPALKLTNNMGRELYNCRLIHDHKNFIFFPGSADFSLNSGEWLEIEAEVSEDCPTVVKVLLTVDFDGGRANVETTLLLEILEGLSPGGGGEDDSVAGDEEENGNIIMGVDENRTANGDGEQNKSGGGEMEIDGVTLQVIPSRTGGYLSNYR